MSIRIAKYINQNGFCSRREAEKLVLEGRVKVNGRKIDDVVTFVSSEDTLEIDGKILTEKKEKIRAWLYYKPRGEVTTRKDEKGRITIFESISQKKSQLPYLISVGRLDIDSEGLIILTNDGNLSRYLELPSNNFERVYRVKAYGDFNEDDISKITKGITIDSVYYKANDISFIKRNNANSWFEVKICEGKNREIRKIFAHIGLVVNRLIRVKYGDFELEDMKNGEIKEVRNLEHILKKYRIT